MMECKLLFIVCFGIKFMCCGVLWFISGSRSRSRRFRYVNRSTVFKVFMFVLNLMKLLIGGCSIKEFVVVF